MKIQIQQIDGKTVVNIGADEEWCIVDSVLEIEVDTVIQANWKE